MTKSASAATTLKGGSGLTYYYTTSDAFEPTPVAAVFVSEGGKVNVVEADPGNLIRSHPGPAFRTLQTR